MWGAAGGRQIELLNRIGQELAAGGFGLPGRQRLAARLRDVLGVQGLSFWRSRADGATREGFDWRGPMSPELGEIDASLAADQIARPAVRMPTALFGTSVTSVPLTGTDDRPVGALQLYGFEPDPADGASGAEFLRSLGGMIGLFLERRQLELGATMLREVHHRIKNNLHTVASLLRMQMRRLDRISAAQALTESINRIQAIALVHDTLSRAENDRVDVPALARVIADGYDAQVTVSGAAPSVGSEAASALALIVNELVQNAVDHGAGAIAVSLTDEASDLVLRVSDRGPGWPLGFDGGAARSNLGLSIVRMLTEEELRGTFRGYNSDGAVAEVRFPHP